MQPGDRLTSSEVQVATLVWQGLTSKDIAGVIGTSEQAVRITCARPSTSWAPGPGWNWLSTSLRMAALPGIYRWEFPPT